MGRYLYFLGLVFGLVLGQTSAALATDYEFTTIATFEGSSAGAPCLTFAGPDPGAQNPVAMTIASSRLWRRRQEAPHPQHRPPSRTHFAYLSHSADRHTIRSHPLRAKNFVSCWREW